MAKWALAAFILLSILGLGWLFYKDTTKPRPGTEVAEMGREHVTDIFGVNYNSNPPTSGSHFAVWAKKGSYDRVLSDGYLIHSLEHGYIVISYDCTKLRSSAFQLVFSVLAHDEPAQESTDSGQILMHLKFGPKAGESWFTPENPPEKEVDLPAEFNSEECKSLVGKLESFTNDFQRVIVVPRLNLETPIVLTAWGRIEKLEDYDETKIREFIKAFENRGPEKTME
jgi:hypothetical protein